MRYEFNVVVIDTKSNVLELGYTFEIALNNKNVK